MPRLIVRPTLKKGINKYRRAVAIKLFDKRKEAGIQRQALCLVLNSLGIPGIFLERQSLRRYEAGETSCTAEKAEAIICTLQTIIDNK